MDDFRLNLHFRLRPDFTSLFNNFWTMSHDFFIVRGTLKSMLCKFNQNRSAATSQGGPRGGNPPVTKKLYKFNQNRSAATSQGGPGGGSPPVTSGGGAEAPPMCSQDQRGNFGFWGSFRDTTQKKLPYGRFSFVTAPQEKHRISTKMLGQKSLQKHPKVASYGRFDRKFGILVKF